MLDFNSNGTAYPECQEDGCLWNDLSLPGNAGCQAWVQSKVSQKVWTFWRGALDRSFPETTWLVGSPQGTPERTLSRLCKLEFTIFCSSDMEISFGPRIQRKRLVTVLIKVVMQKHYADHTKALWIHTYKSRIVKPHIRKRLDAMDSSMDPSTKASPSDHLLGVER